MVAASVATSGESIRRGRGIVTGNSAMTRPGRLERSTTRSPSRTASRTLCVTNSTVSPRSRHSRSTSSCSTSRVIASSAPNGSSISSTFVRWASDRARATRWRIPPESSCGRLRSNSSRCTDASSSRTRSLRSARGTLSSRRARSMLPPAVSQGNSAASWNIRLVFPSTSTVPAVGASTYWSTTSAISVPVLASSCVPTRLSSVLFPQPEAPRMQTNSPGATVSDTRSSAWTAFASSP